MQTVSILPPNLNQNLYFSKTSQGIRRHVSITLHRRSGLRSENSITCLSYFLSSYLSLWLQKPWLPLVKHSLGLAKTITCHYLYSSISILMLKNISTRQTYRPMEQSREPRNSPHTYGQRCQKHTMGKKYSFQQMVLENWTSPCKKKKKWNCTPTLYHTQNQLKMD